MRDRELLATHCRYCGCPHQPMENFEKLEEQCGQKWKKDGMDKLLNTQWIDKVINNQGTMRFLLSAILHRMILPKIIPEKLVVVISSLDNFHSTPLSILSIATTKLCCPVHPLKIVSAPNIKLRQHQE